LPWNSGQGKIEVTALSDDYEDGVVHYLHIFEAGPPPWEADEHFVALVQVQLTDDELRNLRDWCTEALKDNQP